MTSERAAALAFDLRELPDDFYEDPFPTYHRLRRWDPVHRCPDGSYFLTRYDDVAAVYQDHHRFSSDKRVEFAPKFGDSPLYEHHTTSVVFRDPPDHTRIRKLFAPAFTPRALAALEPRVERLVDALLDRAAARGGFDVVEDFAAALPVQLIGDMLGVPADERGPLRGWSLAILGALEPVPGPERLEAGNRAVEEFKAYLRRLIADRRRRPSTDPGEILSALLAAEDAGDRLTEVELLHQCIFLLNAGHETTTNLIANAVVSLLEHPAEHARLRAEPGAAPERRGGVPPLPEPQPARQPPRGGRGHGRRRGAAGGGARDARHRRRQSRSGAVPRSRPAGPRPRAEPAPGLHHRASTPAPACGWRGWKGAWRSAGWSRASSGCAPPGKPVRARRARFRVVSSFPVELG